MSCACCVSLRKEKPCCALRRRITEKMRIRRPPKKTKVHILLSLSLSLSVSLCFPQKSKEYKYLKRENIYTSWRTDKLMAKVPSYRRNLGSSDDGASSSPLGPPFSESKKEKKTHTDSVINLLCIFNEYLGRILFVFILHRRRAAKWLRFFFFLPDNLQL